MASSNSNSSPPSLEELSSRGAAALLLPLILAVDPPREAVVFVNQPTGSITIVEGALDIESLLREIPFKQGPLPATKASIDALPQVQVSEPDLECSICLAAYVVNGGAEVKQMPCSHKFHAGCIDKWLGIRGSCPVCRFSMPVEENKESYESGGVGIHVFIFQGRDDPDLELGMGGAGTGRDDPASELVMGGAGTGRDEDMDSDAGDDGNDELPALDMELDYID